MLFFATTFQSGTEDDDFMFGHPLGNPSGDPNHSIFGNGGDDLIFGDYDFATSTAGSSHAAPQNFDEPILWNTFENPDAAAGGATAVHSALVGGAVGGADWYSVTLNAGQTITIDIDYGTHVIGQDVDTIVEIFSSANDVTPVAVDDDGTTTDGASGSTSSFDSFLTFTPDVTDVYRIKISQFSVGGAPPNFTASLDAGDTYIANVTVNGHAFDDSTLVFGDDFLDGGAGSDVIYGSRGNDTMAGGAGVNTLDGGAGTDVAMFTGGRASYTIEAVGDLLRISDSDETTSVVNTESFQFLDETLTAAQVRALAGGGGTSPPPPPPPPPPPGPTAGADTLTGTDNSEVILGLGGGDLITGLGGSDTLIGAGGRDSLIGNGGSDSLSGGGGSDSLSGGGGRDSLSGGGGRDTLIGGGGKDLLEGGGGRDSLSGGGGRDSLSGGGGGNDILTGGGGRDFFQFGAGDRSDVITDFRQGQDRIEILSGADDFGDLEFDDVADGVRISFSNVRILVIGSSEDDFRINDFVGISAGGGGGGGGGGGRGPNRAQKSAAADADLGGDDFLFDI